MSRFAVMPLEVSRALPLSAHMGSPKTKWDAALARDLITQQQYDQARADHAGDSWFYAGD